MNGYIIRIHTDAASSVLAEMTTHGYITESNILIQTKNTIVACVGGFNSDKLDEYACEYGVAIGEDEPITYLHPDTVDSYGIQYTGYDPVSCAATFFEGVSKPTPKVMTVLQYRLDTEHYPTSAWVELHPSDFAIMCNVNKFVQVWLDIDTDDCVWIPVTSIISFRFD